MKNILWASKLTCAEIPLVTLTTIQPSNIRNSEEDPFFLIDQQIDWTSLKGKMSVTNLLASWNLKEDFLNFSKELWKGRLERSNVWLSNQSVENTLYFFLRKEECYTHFFCNMLKIFCDKVFKMLLVVNQVNSSFKIKF